MALGRMELEKIIQENKNIGKACSKIDECCYNYQYIINFLSQWADETNIGDSIRSDLVSLIKSIQNIMEITKKLDYNITNFVQTQNINNTNSIINKGI